MINKIIAYFKKIICRKNKKSTDKRLSCEYCNGSKPKHNDYWQRVICKREEITWQREDGNVMHGCYTVYICPVCGNELK